MQAQGRLRDDNDRKGPLVIQPVTGTDCKGKKSSPGKKRGSQQANKEGEGEEQDNAASDCTRLLNKGEEERGRKTRCVSCRMKAVTWSTDTVCWVGRILGRQGTSECGRKCMHSIPFQTRRDEAIAVLSNFFLGEGIKQAARTRACLSQALASQCD